MNLKISSVVLILSAIALCHVALARSIDDLLLKYENEEMRSLPVPELAKALKSNDYEEEELRFAHKVDLDSEVEVPLDNSSSEEEESDHDHDASSEKVKTTTVAADSGTNDLSKEESLKKPKKCKKGKSCKIASSDSNGEDDSIDKHSRKHKKGHKHVCKCSQNANGTAGDKMACKSCAKNAKHGCECKKDKNHHNHKNHHHHHHHNDKKHEHTNSTKELTTLADLIMSAIKKGVNITNTNGTTNVIIALAAKGGSVHIKPENNHFKSSGNAFITTSQFGDAFNSKKTTPNALIDASTTPQPTLLTTIDASEEVEYEEEEEEIIVAKATKI